MKRKLVLVTITIIALMSMVVMADGDPGDNPGDIVTNPWGGIEDTTTVQETETTEVQTTSDSVTVNLDGRIIRDVKKGTNLQLPSKANYGYFVNGKIYKPGRTIILQEDVTIVSVNEVNIETSTAGASISLDGRNGIKFLNTVTFKDLAGNDITDLAESSASIEMGMLLTTEDAVATTEELTYDMIGKNVKNVVAESLRDDFSYYCGIINVKKSNIDRKYYGRGYVRLNYSSITHECIYSDSSSALRSIKNVAQMIADNGYQGLNTNEKKYINQILEMD